MLSLIFSLLAFPGIANSQHAGSVPEVHPKLVTFQCSHKHGCVAQHTAVVMDSLKRPLYQIDAPENSCGGQKGLPNSTACPDVAKCQRNCVMEGIESYSDFGVYTHGSTIRLDMLKDDDLSKLSPRVYLLSEDESSYEMLHLAGKEISFQVDVSKLPCGMNGAFYLAEMEEHGGQDEINISGAAYGTGYCDAQCYVYPFVNGKGNIDGHGSCCNELDIWEANARATHLAPHTCNITGLYECQGAECDRQGVCDKPGCAYNPYTLANSDYYGLAGTGVNTRHPFTVLTRFPLDEQGKLQKIERLYVQYGKIVYNAPVIKPNYPEINYLNDDLCDASASDIYLSLGGTVGMGEALARGMVLSMSVWWDESGNNMAWLDQGHAGPCSATEGSPESIRQIQPNAAVTFKNIRHGDIGSTIRVAH